MSGNEFGGLGPHASIDHNVLGPHGDGAYSGNGIAGIDHKIGQDPVHLGEIDEDISPSAPKRRRKRFSVFLMADEIIGAVAQRMRVRSIINHSKSTNLNPYNFNRELVAKLFIGLLLMQWGSSVIAPTT